MKLIQRRQNAYAYPGPALFASALVSAFCVVIFVVQASRIAMLLSILLSVGGHLRSTKSIAQPSILRTVCTVLRTCITIPVFRPFLWCSLLCAPLATHAPADFAQVPTANFASHVRAILPGRIHRGLSSPCRLGQYPQGKNASGQIKEQFANWKAAISR
jgi:hypothetical protein